MSRSSLFIGFGMNDGEKSPAQFCNNILKMVEIIHNNNPLSEIILISTTVPNPKSTWYLNQHLFINEFTKINLPYVTIVDMTNMHLDLLKHKDFKDMTGNNVNHPNDFLIRVYAQSILRKILKEF